MCVFRLFSTKPQPASGTCDGPGQLHYWVCGNPFDRVWPPTTPGHLQPIFSMGYRVESTMLHVRLILILILVGVAHEDDLRVPLQGVTSFADVDFSG